MSRNLNSVPLTEAPTTVDGKPVLKVLQATISDNPEENSYRVVTDDGAQVSVLATEFVSAIGQDAPSVDNNTVNQDATPAEVAAADAQMTPEVTAPVAEATPVAEEASVAQYQPVPEAPAEPVYAPVPNQEIQ